MNKQGLIFGAMIVRKRTYELIKLRKEQNIIEIEVEQQDSRE